MSKLAMYVHFTDSDGNRHVFGPDDEVPAWAAEAIGADHPHAWSEPPLAENTKAPKPTGTPRRPRRSE